MAEPQAGDAHSSHLNEKVEIGLLPYVQAMMLARFIRKDIDDYPVFLIK